MVWTPRELQRYEEMANSDIIYNNMVIKAIENGKKEIEAISIQKGRELGIQEGKELGIQEGKELGIQEGKELGIQEGKELGIQEGKELGIQEGEAIGIEKGKLSIKIELAQKFKNKGLPIQDIISFTELTEEEINSL